MKFRRTQPADLPVIEMLLARHAARHARFNEIVRAALVGSSNEYIAAVNGDPVQSVAAYGIVAGTIGTAALYGLVPVSSPVTGLLSFVAHDVQKMGARRIIAEFPDTDEFKPYRDVLLESGYDPTGLVEDFYRDGVAMVIFTRKLTA